MCTDISEMDEIDYIKDDLINMLSSKVEYLYNEDVFRESLTHCKYSQQIEKLAVKLLQMVDNFDYTSHTDCEYLDMLQYKLYETIKNYKIKPVDENTWEQVKNEQESKPKIIIGIDEDEIS